MQEELIISFLFNCSLRNAVILGVQQEFIVKHQLTVVNYKFVFLLTLILQLILPICYKLATVYFTVYTLFLFSQIL